MLPWISVYGIISFILCYTTGNIITQHYTAKEPIYELSVALICNHAVYTFSNQIFYYLMYWFVGVLTLHLLDTVSGIIIYSVVHKRASHPIHLVHSENWLLCSYYNDKTRRTEIASYELYDGNQLSNSTGITIR